MREVLLFSGQSGSGLFGFRLRRPHLSWAGPGGRGRPGPGGGRDRGGRTGEAVAGPALITDTPADIINHHPAFPRVLSSFLAPSLPSPGIIVAADLWPGPHSSHPTTPARRLGGGGAQLILTMLKQWLRMHVLNITSALIM